MTHGRDSDATLLEAAAAEAVSAARWERVDLEACRPGGAHVYLIMAKADELASSPIGRDQLMSLALAAGVRNSDAAGLLVGSSAPPAERAVIAERLFKLGRHSAAETKALVVQIEERNVRRLGDDARFDLLPQRLRQDAALQKSLWNHPAIPAGDEVRLAMLWSIPRLLERVEALSSNWVRQFVTRWVHHFANRGAQ